jgi:DNA-binding CsgD family transcriptional regulator
VSAGSEGGWLALARSERAGDPVAAVEQASAALATATRAGDADLELHARAASPRGRSRRLELARATAESGPEAAVDFALRARRELESLGAEREADAAAAFLRELGAKGRSGPRDHGLLSKRETDVLRLLGEGLSNGEIAARLFISPKTAEHHVGRIYAKLELRGRAEAAAYATRNLGRE